MLAFYIIAALASSQIGNCVRTLHDSALQNTDGWDPTGFWPSRDLLVTVVPNIGQITVPFDESLIPVSPDIPLWLPPIVKVALGLEPEQVHLAYFGEGSVLVSWATGDAQVGIHVTPPGSSNFQSMAQLGTQTGRYDSNFTGSVFTYKYDYNLPGGPKPVTNYTYASPLLHHVVVTGLTPGQQYFYRVGDPSFGVWSQEFNFSTVKRNSLGSLPLRIAILADPGQTYNTTATFDHLLSRNPQPDIVFSLGDLSYADHYLASGQSCPGFCEGVTYQPRWDSYGRLWQHVAARLPTISTNGNHEIEPLASDRTFQKAYNFRYPAPPPEGKSKRKLSIKANTKASPNHNMYFSVDLPGTHSIWITSYIQGDDFGKKSAQYKWLADDLKKVDRTKTPWVVVSMHAPWYTTYPYNFLENECMRQAYEPLLYKYGVDLVLTGHIHAYERTQPMYDFKVDTCGPSHITLGNAGNWEGSLVYFQDTLPPNQVPAWCQNPFARKFPWYQPQACWPTGANTSNYCITSQPVWSAYRDPSFGHGLLEVHNATHATLEWNRNQDGKYVMSDRVTFTKPAAGVCRSGR